MRPCGLRCASHGRLLCSSISPFSALSPAFTPDDDEYEVPVVVTKVAEPVPVTKLEEEEKPARSAHVAATPASHSRACTLFTTTEGGCSQENG